MRLADVRAHQEIEQSKRAVEINTMRAEAEVQPLLRVAERLRELSRSGDDALASYLRNVRLGLFERAKRLVTEVKS